MDTQCPTVATVNDMAPLSSSQPAASPHVASESVEAHKRQLARMHTGCVTGETVLPRKQPHMENHHKHPLQHLFMACIIGTASQFKVFTDISIQCSLYLATSRWVAPARQKCITFI